ncbi:uncharacterized protein LOC128883209 [Hylaeus volcanicus]|uniref:uncharacterized protein LOC128883209 n=1 Tax=Hylaeus volcanicus TaxID=313075 RepID=UPI0023B799DC|nr:uncharacterized protein LOC128883209 [Hylaeus volcanicus]
MKHMFISRNGSFYVLLVFFFYHTVFNRTKNTIRLNVLVFSAVQSVKTVRKAKHATSQERHGTPRSTPLNGKRIAAFESLPEWVSDSRFAKHTTAERKKIILQKIKQEEDRVKLNEAWCEFLIQGVQKNEKEDVHFIINPFQMCKRKKNSMTRHESLLNTTQYILDSETADYSTQSFIDVSPTTFPKVSLENTLDQKQHIVEAFSQTVATKKGNMGLALKPYQHDYMLQFGQPDWSVRVHHAGEDKITEFSSGFRPFQMEAMTSGYTDQVSVGVGYEKYGVFVDRSIQGKSVTVAVLSPKLETTTMADFQDHQYGQRFRIKNFEINLRHDFDEAEHPDPQEYSTEFLVGYKDKGVMLVSDIHDKVYGFGVHVRGHQISLLHDFDDFITQVEAKTKKGFQLTLGYDLPDKKSQAISAQVGIGRPKSAFVQIGAQVNSDGLPGVTIKFGKKQSHVSIGVRNTNNISTINYAVNSPTSSLSNAFSVDLNHLKLPELLGHTPEYLNSLVESVMFPFKTSSNKKNTTRFRPMR